VDTDMMRLKEWKRADLLSRDVMLAPALWLLSDDADNVTGMRIVGKEWDPSLDPQVALKAASAKAGW
jgi:3-oxoacyl-[acyl-carrier protein] reductase